MQNSKICFITLGNLYLCPYIKKYIALINCSFDVIYWDRHNIEENIGAERIFSFKYNMNDSAGKLKKLYGYLKFRKYAVEILENNNYDKIVLLQTSAGIFLQSILLKKYRKKYIVDIRDYTMEDNPIFFAIEEKLIKNSAFAVISSKGYEKFLPAYNYILVHNDIFIDEDVIKKFENKARNKNKIVISFIGLIRFQDQNKKVILKFINDDRFILKFIGKNALLLKNFCEEHNIKNVELIDMFPPEKTLDYYYEADIIYNLYGNNTPLLDYALSNKLYYAAKLKMPILVCPNTYMAEVSEKNGFGIVFDIDKTNAIEKLYETYNSIDWHELNIKSNSFLMEVENDNNLFNNIIKNFLC